MTPDDEDHDARADAASASPYPRHFPFRARSIQSQRIKIALLALPFIVGCFLAAASVIDLQSDADSYRSTKSLSPEVALLIGTYLTWHIAWLLWRTRDAEELSGVLVEESGIDAQTLTAFRLSWPQIAGAGVLEQSRRAWLIIESDALEGRPKPPRAAVLPFAFPKGLFPRLAAVRSDMIKDFSGLCDLIGEELGPRWRGRFKKLP